MAWRGMSLINSLLLSVTATREQWRRRLHACMQRDGLHTEQPIRPDVLS